MRLRNPRRTRFPQRMEADVGAKETEMDITDRIEAFREAARHIWNVHFSQESLRNENWDLRDAFSEVYVALFKAMVCFDLPGQAPTIPHLWEPANTVLMPYHVVGNSDLLAIMVDRTKPASPYAGVRAEPKKYVVAKAVDLRLITLFDWYELGLRDFRYLRVRIVKADDVDLVDRDALAEVTDCRVEYEEPQPQAAPAPAIPSP